MASSAGISSALGASSVLAGVTASLASSVTLAASALTSSALVSTVLETSWTLLVSVAGAAAGVASTDDMVMSVGVWGGRKKDGSEVDAQGKMQT